MGLGYVKDRRFADAVEGERSSAGPAPASDRPKTLDTSTMGKQTELSMTFRGIPVCEELFFYARRLARETATDPRLEVHLEVVSTPNDVGGVTVGLESKARGSTARFQANGHPFLAVRDVFEELAQRTELTSATTE